ncbi:helix-turn-helix domain-containing protein [Streptomyces sp. NPDC047990]|uniref:helix-turn-helix domain-containing protein n=1 Tax=Streptomyces sp. NPDC047990 TaxID=3365496 RepID=UPI0037103561
MTTREQLRLQAPERFEGGQKNVETAAVLRISVPSVERWRRAWRDSRPPPSTGSSTCSSPRQLHSRHRTDSRGFTIITLTNKRPRYRRATA